MTPEAFEKLNYEKATEYIAGVEDRDLAWMLGAALQIGRKLYVYGKPTTHYDEPLADPPPLDMLFVVRVVHELLRDKAVAAAELNGERPGAWFEDEA